MRKEIEKILDNNIDYYGTSKEKLMSELCFLFSGGISLPNEEEVEKKAEYMQRPRNPKNNYKEEFIYGYMQGADWIISKIKPED